MKEYGGRKLWLQSLTSRQHYMELRSQLHALAGLPTEKQSQVPTEYEVGHFGQQKKNLSPLPEIEPQFLGCSGNSLTHTLSRCSGLRGTEVIYIFFDVGKRCK